MKKIFLPFVAVIVCLVNDTASRAISATTSSPLAISPPGSIRSSRFLIQTGDDVMRPSNQAKTLTFAERVKYQRAIEDVYWRHRLWPKENARPKPSLDAVMTQVQLEGEVEDYLRQSRALNDYWQRPITAEQLQAEMERMAKHTKQPQVLHELFEALGNDPFVVAECLARPVLAERLLEHSASEQVKQTSQPYEHVVAVTSNYSLPSISEAGGCTDDTWTATGSTHAPAARAFHTAVWTGSEMIVWGGSNDGTGFNTGGRYRPSIDNWAATSTVPCTICSIRTYGSLDW